MILIHAERKNPLQVELTFMFSDNSALASFTVELTVDETRQVLKAISANADARIREIDIRHGQFGVIADDPKHLFALTLANTDEVKKELEAVL